MWSTKNVTQVILWVSLFAVALFVLTSSIWSSLSFAGHRPIVIVSGSMAPAMRRGDLIVLGPATDVSVGDIITFRPTTGSISSITHRVIGIRQTINGIAYETKGDANRTADADLVPASNVIGVSTFRIPAVGYLSLLIQNRSTLAMFAFAFLCMELSVWMPKFRYAETTTNKQKEQV